MTGPRTPRSWLAGASEPFDFYDLKGVVDALLNGLHLQDVAFRSLAHPTFHPARVAALSVGGVEVGVLGEVHPTVCLAYGLGEGRVCLAEFNLEKLLVTAGQAVQMVPVSTYPAVYEDLAIVVDRAVPAVEVRKLIAQTGGRLLRKVELFDVYEGEQVGAGKKSLAYALTYQADNKTLNAKDVNRVRTKIVRRLESVLGATLRA
jgi:phenylalanyl-tRNA synthetase beta chain